MVIFCRGAGGGSTQHEHTLSRTYLRNGYGKIGDIVSLVVFSNAHSLPMLMVFLRAFLLLNVKFIQGTVSQQ